MPSSYKALFLDLGGVLYDGKHVIGDAADSIEHARRKETVLRFVTNTATKNSDFIIDKLSRMGIQVNDGELFTAPIAARQYIEKQGLRPYCLVHQAILADFDTLDQSDPNCVLIGDAQDGLNYKALNKAFRLCKQGASLIGIGMNKYFKDQRGLNLDAGPFIRAIEWAADTTATIMGKPSKEFYDEIVASTHFTAQECLMVGDDVQGDVIGAIEAGLQGCLVRTGKYHLGDEDNLTPDALVFDSVTDLVYDHS